MNKNNIAYIILGVIILILVLCIVIIYNENEKEKQELFNKVNVEDIEIDSNIEELYSILLKWNKFEVLDDSTLKSNKTLGTFYSNEKVSAFRYDTEQRYAAVFLALQNAEQLPNNSYESKMGFENDTYDINKYTLEEAKLRMIQLFDTDVIEEINIQLGNEIVEFTQDGVYSYKTNGASVERNEYAFGKIEKAKKNIDNNEIYIYDKYVFFIKVKDENGNERIEAYTNSNMTNKISDDVSGVIDLNQSENDIVSKMIELYGDKIKTYKHTFRLDSNNNVYYWASSEQESEY